ncbi:hypothetical protein P3S67_001564 [Capsicum chacoense]
MELIKKELAGATAIRRAVRKGQPSVEALHDHTTATDSRASSGGIVGGVDICVRHFDATSSHDVEHVDAQEKINIFENTPFTDPSHHYTDAITKTVEELKSKRGIIPSKKVRKPYTPTVAVGRKKRAINQVFSNSKSKKNTTLPSPKVIEVQGSFKKVDIYAELGAK